MEDWAECLASLYSYNSKAFNRGTTKSNILGNKHQKLAQQQLCQRKTYLKVHFSQSSYSILDMDCQRITSLILILEFYMWVNCLSMSHLVSNSDLCRLLFILGLIGKTLCSFISKIIAQWKGLNWSPPKVFKDQLQTDRHRNRPLDKQCWGKPTLLSLDINVLRINRWFNGLSFCMDWQDLAGHLFKILCMCDS